MERKHIRKMIAPILVTVLLTLYCLVYFTVLIHLTGGFGTLLGFLLIAIPVVIGATLLCVFIERIKEIKGGVVDDLSNY